LTANRFASQTDCVEDDADEDFGVFDALRSTSRWRANVRAIRHDCWFALITFGVVSLAATPFFWQTAPGCPNDCRSPAVSALSAAPSPGPLGNPLVNGFVNTGIGRWISLYWVVALPLGFLVTVLYYRRRVHETGLSGPIWPAVCLGFTLISLLVVFSSNFLMAFHLEQLSGWFPVFTFPSRGLGPLLIIGICVGVLAVAEHRPSLMAVAGIFLVVSLLANVNMSLQPPGVGFHLPPSAQALPNLIVPGLILIFGGIGFWWSDKRTLHAFRER
jgi:hypothetical protein